jgi:hypothetical protein
MGNLNQQNFEITKRDGVGNSTHCEGVDLKYGEPSEASAGF